MAKCVGKLGDNEVAQLFGNALGSEIARCGARYQMGGRKYFERSLRPTGFRMERELRSDP